MMVARPHRSYLVCATPRSGSTLLCRALAATGVAGRPEEYFEQLVATGLPRQPREYFDDGCDPSVLALLAPSEHGRPASTRRAARRLQNALREGTTPNGVFGAKVMWGYFGDLLAGLRADGEMGSDAALVAAAFGDVAYVQVLRRDKVAQAVSLWRALQTQAWHDEGDGPGSREAVYHQGAIAHLVDQLTAHEEAWSAWFEAQAIEPIRLVYEDFADDVMPGVCELLDRLGIDCPHARDVPAPPLRRQADERSREWARRFAGHEAGAVP
jgi:trehalose 2-sulfotransferase